MTPAENTLLLAPFACSSSERTATEYVRLTANLRKEPSAGNTWQLLDMPAQVTRRALCILQKPHSVGAKQDRTKK